MRLIAISRLTALQKSFLYVDLMLKKHLLLSVIVFAITDNDSFAP